MPTFEEGNEHNFLDKKDSETCSPDINSLLVSSLQSNEDSTPHREVFTRIHEMSDVPVSLNSNCSDQLKQFGVIDTCSDHHFFNEGKGLPFSQVAKSINRLSDKIISKAFRLIFFLSVESFVG